MTRRTLGQLQVELARPGRGRGRAADRRRGRRRHRPSCRSTSRPGSSRRSCAAAQHTEVTDITSRICGICPVAYQTSAWQAIEDACGVSVDEQIAALRRLLYCGEWISSHALHIYLLHAPDFLGYPDAIALASDHRDLVERGLALKKAGNAILELVGGRAIHPVNTRVGGFYRAPTAAELAPLAEQLRHALDAALATVRVGGRRSTSPTLELDHELLAVHDPSAVRHRGRRARHRRRPGLPGRASSATHVVEHQVPHSTALHAALDGAPLPDRPAGPVHAQLRASSRRSPARRRPRPGSAPACRNPFRSIVVRAVEIVYAIDEALRHHRRLQRPAPPAVEVPAASRRRARGERGAARPAVPPLRARRRRADPRGDDRAADVAEPGRDRGRPAPRRVGATSTSTTPRSPRCASGRSATTTRASPARRTSSISPSSAGDRCRAAVVIGVGNEFRRDDGIGPAVVAELRHARAARCLRHRVRRRTDRADRCLGGRRLSHRRRRRALRAVQLRGAIHRYVDLGHRRRPSASASASTHGLGIPEAVRLAEALGRVPAGWSSTASRAPSSGSVPGCRRPSQPRCPKLRPRGARRAGPPRRPGRPFRRGRSGGPVQGRLPAVRGAAGRPRSDRPLSQESHVHQRLAGPGRRRSPAAGWSAAGHRGIPEDQDRPAQPTGASICHSVRCGVWSRPQPVSAAPNSRPMTATSSGRSAWAASAISGMHRTMLTMSANILVDLRCSPTPRRTVPASEGLDRSSVQEARSVLVRAMPRASVDTVH